MSERSSPLITTRRKVLTGLGAGPMAASALALGAGSGCTRETTDGSQRKRIPFDPSDYKASSHAFLKLTGSLGTETIRKWFTGKIYAYIPGEPTRELFYGDGFYLTQYEALPDGTHLGTRYEVTIKRSLQTGDLLETWENPFTGRVDTVGNNVGGPQQKLYNDWGFDKPEYPRTPDRPLDLDWMVFGNDAWVTWDLFLRFKNPLQPDKYPLQSSGEMLDLVNLTNYKGKLDDIEDPDVLNAPGVLIYNAISSWQPFMRMGQTPGALFYKFIGVKLRSFKDMPAQVFDAAEKAFPGYLSEQVAWADGAYSWYDVSGEPPPDHWVNEEDRMDKNR